MRRRVVWQGALISGLVVAGVVVQGRPWGWDWRGLWTDLAANVGLLVACFAAGLLVSWAVALVRGRPRAEPASRRWPWLLSYPGVATIVTAVAAVGVVALVIMLEVASGSTAAERPKLQIDAIKYGLGVFAAAGAVAALLLGIRRQQHLEYAQEHIERAQRHTELDAAERRVTELYTKAAEQLGHADAAVRLAGLYSLERLAQNNVTQRQTIVNVICAYLRMPFTPSPPSAAPPDEARDPQQEAQVRLTAQAILASHVARPEGSTPQEADALEPDPNLSFWPGTNLNLTGATLMEWNLTRGQPGHVSFNFATFLGTTRFLSTTFTDRAWFDMATFSGDVRFRDAIFSGYAGFRGTTFSGSALFDGATFALSAGLDGATFSGDAKFRGTTFAGVAWFNQATFAGYAGFDAATFSSGAVFRRAAFGGYAVFDRACFSDKAGFDRATFAGIALFGDAVFAGIAGFDGATFFAHAGFDGATFAGNVWFHGAKFHQPINLSASRVRARGDRADSWPPGWRLDRNEPERLIHETGPSRGGTREAG